MNAMLFGLVDQAICVRLTETLLHFVWEGEVIGTRNDGRRMAVSLCDGKNSLHDPRNRFRVIGAQRSDHFFVDRFTLRSFDPNGRDVGGSGESISALSKPMSQVGSIADAQPRISSAQVEPSVPARPASDEMLSVAMRNQPKKESFDTRDASISIGRFRISISRATVRSLCDDGLPAGRDCNVGTAVSCGLGRTSAAAQRRFRFAMNDCWRGFANKHLASD